MLETEEGTYREPDVSVDEATFRQMWDGYMCPYCFQPWEERFPARCTMPGCWSGDVSEAAMRKYIWEHFGGEKWLGPSRGTLAALDNYIDAQNTQPKGDSTIWVPGDVT